MAGLSSALDFREVSPASQISAPLAPTGSRVHSTSGCPVAAWPGCDGGAIGKQVADAAGTRQHVREAQ